MKPANKVKVAIKPSSDYVPDVIRGLSLRDPDALANLACFAVDSAAGGDETYVGIDFLKYRAQITYIESKSPLERLTIAEEIIGYLKASILKQRTQAHRPMIA